MNCEKCGNSNSTESQYCGGCGSALMEANVDRASPLETSQLSGEYPERRENGPTARLQGRKKTALLLACAVVLLGFLSFFGYQRYERSKVLEAQQAERAKAVQAVESLIREDRAGVETMISTVNSDNITYGDVKKEYERQIENRQKLTVQARTLDYKSFPDIREKYIALLEAENKLVRALKAFSQKQGTFQVARENRDDWNRNHRVDPRFGYRTFGNRRIFFGDFNSRVNTDVAENKQRVYENAKEEMAPSAHEVLDALNGVTALEADFKAVSESQKIDFKPVFANVQEKIQQEAEAYI